MPSLFKHACNEKYIMGEKGYAPLRIACPRISYRLYC